MKHLEVKTIEYKGIKVTLKLDYENATASLVEILHAGGQMQTPAKSWVFAGRTLDYMNGWLNILDAMKAGVEQAKKDLEHDLAEKSAFKEKKMIDLDVMINAHDRKKAKLAKRKVK